MEYDDFKLIRGIYFVLRPHLAKVEGLQSLFIDIAEFIQGESQHENLTQEAGEGQYSKKRKLVAIRDLEDQGQSHENWKSGSYCTIQDVSFSIPQRKKLTLEIGNSASQGVRGRNPSSNDVEFTVKWTDIRRSFRFYFSISSAVLM